MEGATAAQLRAFGEFLADDDTAWEYVADAIAASRDLAPRHPWDRDSGDVVTDLAAALRNA